MCRMKRARRSVAALAATRRASATDPRGGRTSPASVMWKVAYSAVCSAEEVLRIAHVRAQVGRHLVDRLQEPGIDARAASG